jgi:hypothetical protein
LALQNYSKGHVQLAHKLGAPLRFGTLLPVLFGRFVLFAVSFSLIVTSDHVYRIANLFSLLTIPYGHFPDQKRGFSQGLASIGWRTDKSRGLTKNLAGLVSK